MNQELRDALHMMVHAFRPPFTLRPLGAPGSEVRCEQESQIEAYTNALRVLAATSSVTSPEAK